MTLGLVRESGTRAYLFEQLAALGQHAVVNDEFEEQPIVVVSDSLSGWLSRTDPGFPL
jgi:hypothetical protein